MKKNLSIVFLIFNLLFYLTIIGVGTINRQVDILPKSVDEQILTVDQVFVGDEKTPVMLPSYFDVQGELRLRMSLTYQFKDHTAPSFIVQANHSFMTVLLDGQEIYHVEQRDHSLGNYFINVPLPSQLNEAELEVRITVPQGGIERIEFSAPIIADESVYLKEQILNDIPSLMLSTLILFCGLFVIGLSISSRRHIALHQMMQQGLLASCCSVYFLCETFSVVYLSQSSWIIYVVDMLSFAMIAPLFLTMLVWESEGWRKQLVQWIIVLGLLNVTVQAVLGLSGVVELRRMLPLTHLTQIASIAAITVCLIYRIVRRNKLNNLLLCYGLIVVGAVLDLTLFYFENRYSNMFFAKIAILAYFVQQIYVFVRLLMKKSADKARENYYKTLALQDSLTGCFSRAAFEDDRKTIDKNCTYTVFCLDLNNLKQTNDIYGHSMGDQLIHSMGELIKQSFQSIGKCYRVGGDEFWIICNGLEQGKAQNIISSMNKITELRNTEQDIPVELSYSVGFCDTVETNGDLKLAIELADERMYKNKRQLKNNKY